MLQILFEPRAVNTVMTRHGKLDILLNNAGVATRWHKLEITKQCNINNIIIIWPDMEICREWYMLTSRNHPNDPPEHLDVAEMTNVFATNVGGTCAATQVVQLVLNWKNSGNLRDVIVYLNPKWNLI